MPFKSVAIAGASGSDSGFSTGQFIADAIIKKMESGQIDTVLLIGRSLTDAKKKATIDSFIARGAKYVATDYTNTPELAQKLSENKVECVISCLAVQDPTAIGSAEPGLIKACAEAKCVRRVFPSQYGPDDELLPGEKSIVYGRKRKIIDLILSLGMTTTIVVTGIYIDVMWTWRIMGWKEGAIPEAILIGNGGEGTVMGITREDIGKFIAEMVVDKDESKTKNATIRIVGDCWRSGDEIKIYEQVTGKTVKIQHFPLKVPINHPKHTHPLSVYPRLLATDHFFISPSLWDHTRWNVSATTLREFCEAEFGKNGRHSKI